MSSVLGSLTYKNWGIWIVIYHCSKYKSTPVFPYFSKKKNFCFLFCEKQKAYQMLWTNSTFSLYSVSCSYPTKNITIKIDENSNYPYYLGFVIWYQQGKRDITAVQLCEVICTNCNIKCIFLNLQVWFLFATTWFFI